MRESDDERPTDAHDVVDEASIEDDGVTVTTVPDAHLRNGTDVGGYVIDGELGAGGMGVVYSATHPVIGKRAAIKVLKPELSNNPAAVERFVMEARAVNQIGHPNIVDIFAFGKLPDGRSYYVMDLLTGESLRRRIKRTGPLHPAEAIGIIDETASALMAAHDKGIVHRDLKPDNVFMVSVPGRWPEVRLLDWGLLKLTSQQSAISSSKYRTLAGSVMGTPVYMSPEQARASDAVDFRTDVYSLGVMSYELLTGVVPFKKGTSIDTLLAHQDEPVPPLADKCPALPIELVQLIEAMLAKDPDGRPTLAAARAVIKRLRGTKIPTMTAAGLQMPEAPTPRPSFAEPAIDPATGPRPPFVEPPTPRFVQPATDPGAGFVEPPTPRFVQPATDPGAGFVEPPAPRFIQPATDPGAGFVEPPTPRFVQPTTDPGAGFVEPPTSPALQRGFVEPPIARLSAETTVPRLPASNSQPPAIARTPTPPQPSIGRAPSQSSMDRAPSQPSIGRAPSQPSIGRAPSQSSMGRAPSQPSMGRAPSQSSMDRAPSQSSMGRAPSQPSIGRAPSQSSMDRAPSQSSMGRAPSQSSMDRAPSQSSMGRAPSQPSMGRAPSQPSIGRAPAQTSIGRAPTSGDRAPTPGSPSIVGNLSAPPAIGRAPTTPPVATPRTQTPPGGIPRPGLQRASTARPDSRSATTTPPPMRAQTAGRALTTPPGGLPLPAPPRSERMQSQPDPELASQSMTSLPYQSINVSPSTLAGHSMPSTTTSNASLPGQSIPAQSIPMANPGMPNQGVPISGPYGAMPSYPSQPSYPQITRQPTGTPQAMAATGSAGGMKRILVIALAAIVVSAIGIALVMLT